MKIQINYNLNSLNNAPNITHEKDSGRHHSFLFKKIDTLKELFLHIPYEYAWQHIELSRMKRPPQNTDVSLSKKERFEHLALGLFECIPIINTLISINDRWCNDFPETLQPSLIRQDELNSKPAANAPSPPANSIEVNRNWKRNIREVFYLFKENDSSLTVKQWIESFKDILQDLSHQDDLPQKKEDLFFFFFEQIHLVEQGPSQSKKISIVLLELKHLLLHMIADEKKISPYEALSNLPDNLLSFDQKERLLRRELFENSLLDWQNAPHLLGEKSEAVQRIRNAYIMDFSTLDLGDLSLNSLPICTKNLQNLQVLSLDNNSFSFFPTYITEMSSLQKLNLSYNQLTFLPSSIKDLSKLEELLLSSNFLKNLPDEISSLSKLKKLNLDKNCFIVLPSSMGKLTSLETLILRNNPDLLSLPISLMGIPFLKTLSIEGTKISKEIVTEILKEPDFYR